jgi:hypothetical protein
VKDARFFRISRQWALAAVFADSEMRSLGSTTGPLNALLIRRDNRNHWEDYLKSAYAHGSNGVKTARFSFTMLTLIVVIAYSKSRLKQMHRKPA